MIRWVVRLGCGVIRNRYPNPYPRYARGMSVAEATAGTTASLVMSARVAELTALIRSTSGETHATRAKLLTVGLKVLRRTPRA